MPRVQAALLGAREVGFTVTSISFSLIAVFLPILLMGGIVGRLFREFAMTLSLAILVLSGFGFIVQMASSNTVIQTIVEGEKRGRVMSFYVMAFLGTAPLGSLLAGT